MPRVKEFSPDEAFRLRRIAERNSKRAKKAAETRRQSRLLRNKKDEEAYARLEKDEKRALAAGEELREREAALPIAPTSNPVVVPDFKLTEKQQEAVDNLFAAAFRYVMLVGGSRSGKTFLIVYLIVARAIRAPQSRHAIFRLRLNACRASVYNDTFKKVMRICFPSIVYEWHSMDSYISLPNGSEIWFGGLDDKERVEKILGMEYATIYCNESSQISWGAVELLMTRLAQQCTEIKNKFFCDLNPTTKKHWTYKLFIQNIDPTTNEQKPAIEHEDYGWMRVNPVDNVANLDSEYLKSLTRASKRTRKRFLEGEYLDAVDNALWTPELLETQRIEKENAPVHFERMVVALDPSGAKGEEDKKSDEIGICVAGRVGKRCYILLDATMKGKPEQWGGKSVDLYRAYLADCVVGEKNFGGDMVRSTIHAVDSSVKFKPVTAARGKVVRAEPVSAFYEAGRVFHVGEFKELEEEMYNFTTDGYKGDRSPNRTDALVWAVTELLGGAQANGLIDFMREKTHGEDPHAVLKRVRPPPLVQKKKPTVNIPIPIERATETVVVNGVTHTVRNKGWGNG